MQDIQIAGLKDNTNIVAFGSLFRRVNGSQWGVNLELWPAQDKKSLSVSQLPVLVRKRTLNPTVPPRVGGYKRHIAIENTDDWEVCNIADCPVQTGKQISSQEARQTCFYFKSTTGLNVYLPQIELARALFLHDGYLSRTALETDALKIEYDIVPDVEEDLTTINILDVAGCAKTSLDYYANRRVLGWILLDPDARKSYESIGRYQRNDGIEVNGYRHWYFQFDPPPLPEFELNIKGQYDQDTNSIFVWEITSIGNIIHSLPAKVKFYSPKFKEQVRGEGTGGGLRPPDERPDEHNVQDGEDANSNTNHVMLHAPAVGISFAKPFEATKVFKKKQNGANGRKDDEEGKEASKDVSTEEGDVTGGTPQADWNIPEDNSDDAHLYKNKFQCFSLMLEKLETEHNCKIISKQIRKLPKIGRCERHLLKNEGLPRCLAVVAINCNDKVFHILEVDTSDAAKSLSTKLLLINDQGKWDGQLIEQERQLLKGSLSWPAKYFDLICGIKRHESIPHPRTKSINKGELEADSIGKWARRFHGWMLSI